jgi:hypothetical protein
VSAYYLAVAAASTGNDDEAIGYLRKGLADRDPALLYIRTLPLLKSLEKRPEFTDLLRQTGW